LTEARNQLEEMEQTEDVQKALEYLGKVIDDLIDNKILKK